MSNLSRPRLFFTADTHFGRNAILKIAARTQFMTPDERAIFLQGSDEEFRSLRICHESLFRMEDEIVRRWNDSVGDDDLVFHLGDFASGGLDRIRGYRSRLRGRIVLVPGNRDGQAVRPCLRDLWHGVLDEVCSFREGSGVIETGIADRDYLLMHDPARVPYFGFSTEVAAILHGHAYGFAPPGVTVPIDHLDVGMDAHDFRPIPLTDLPKLLAMPKIYPTHRGARLRDGNPIY